MTKHGDSQVSEPTLKRLPRYLHFLKKAQENGLLTISAPLIGRELNCDATQVVKDLAATGATGRPRVGYNIYEVIQCIEDFLGFNRSNEAFLVGAGHLGRAMMSYPNFQQYGLKIVAAFDNEPEKLGRIATGINIIHMDKFRKMAEKLKVRIAILTTPADVAQEVANQLVNSGITAIWNLTPSNLTVPAGVIVQNTSMYANVAVLLKKLYDSESKSEINP
jgi:redox-sensing transcriptional repressor